MLYVIDIAEPDRADAARQPAARAHRRGRGPGHIANFVTADCTHGRGSTAATTSRSSTSRDPAAPKSLGIVPVATRPSARSRQRRRRSSSRTTPSATRRARCGRSAAAASLATGSPPTRSSRSWSSSSGIEGVNIDFDGDELAVQRLHPPQLQARRTPNTLLVTEEDYVDTDEDAARQLQRQGKFETWRIKPRPAEHAPLDTWQTELNGFVAGGSAEDSKAPVTANCSSHWFDYRNGVAAVGWYEQGVRFLDVRNPRDIRQVGYYLPADGATWAAYWAPGASNIVYTADADARASTCCASTDPATRSAATVAAPILHDWFGVAGERSSVPGFVPEPAVRLGLRAPDLTPAHRWPGRASGGSSTQCVPR